jgi:outer membrane protein TolC
MKKVFLIVSILSFAGSFYGQTSITLEESQQLAVDNYPLIRQYGLIELSERYTLSNIAKNYLPQFGLNAQATYQSDVTKLPIDEIPTPGGAIKIPTQNKDRYKAVIEASQLIWDGGATASQRKIAEANTEVEKQSVEVNLYAVKERVNQLYFGILSIDEQLKILDLTEKNLLENRKIAQSMFNNGVAGQSDLDLIDVELLNLEQRRIEQKSIRQASVKMLGLFVHRHLEENTILQKPQEAFTVNGDILRPELRLFSSRISMLNAQVNALNARNMPRLNLFVQGGYGRPGLNMLENEFRPFAMGGVRLTWNFGSLYTKRNERRLLENSISSIDVQKETFLFGTTVQLTQELAEIQKAKDLLAKDDDIIRLRNRVKTASESKYKNGVYQMNELIRDINAGAIAQQSKALHEVQCLMNIYKCKYIKGEE